jgi:hypothetical protein
MTRTTAKALLTGIKRLLRSSIEHRLRMLPDRENLSVAGLTKADRTFPGEVAIVEALTAEVAGNQAFPTAVVAKVPLEEVSEAVRQDNRVTVAAPAAKAVLHEVGVEVVAAEAEGAPVVVAVEAEEAVVAAAAGNCIGENNRRFHTIKPWRKKRCLRK